MRIGLFLLIMFACLQSRAQHCPWDCSGMIVVKTDIPRATLNKLKPVLVDEEHRVMTDTVWGTGKEDKTNDRCDFLYYDDFLKNRVQKTKLHHFYNYDTMYYFAKGLYMVKYNYCEYGEKKIYLRYNDPEKGEAQFHYLEIPDKARIHLHDHASELWDHKGKEMRKSVSNAILALDWKELGFK
ncbi:MAG TPA: hypothetical protein VLJ68_09645 [Chitinophagaceae bacterium]|nr:hypothetical protein [Chitinophagaceae bacterium]